MLSAFFGFLLNLLGGSFTEKVLGYLEKKADSETEKVRIASALSIAHGNNQTDIIRTAMGFKVFWIAWSMAAMPLAFWFGWGVLDSALFNGALLPDVAALPPQLKAYADIVWSNIFYVGAAGAAAQTIQTGLQTLVKIFRKP